MMRRSIILLILVIALCSCDEPGEISSINPVNWERRRANKDLDSLILGKTYLSVYSEIYNFSERQTHNLTATISMRNMNEADTVYLLNAKYYNTKGEAIRTYFDTPVYLAPMETVEIVVDENDEEGGTGANFIFDWKVKPTTEKPLFEAVMISNVSSLGVSFTTYGKDYENLK